MKKAFLFLLLLSQSSLALTHVLGFIQTEETRDIQKIQKHQILDKDAFLYEDFGKLVFEHQQSKYDLMDVSSNQLYKAAYRDGVFALLYEEEKAGGFELSLLVVDINASAQPLIYPLGKSVLPFQMELVDFLDMRGEIVFVTAYAASENGFKTDLKIKAYKIVRGIVSNSKEFVLDSGDIKKLSISSSSLVWGNSFALFSYNESFTVSKTGVFSEFEQVKAISDQFFFAKKDSGETFLLVLGKNGDLNFFSLPLSSFEGVKVGYTSYKEGVLLSFVQADYQFENLNTYLFYLDGEQFKKLATKTHALPSEFNLNPGLSVYSKLSNSGNLDLIISSSVLSQNQKMTYQLNQNFEPI